MPLETIKYKNHSINIHQDDNPQNPREDDNLGTMVCFHNRYTLGDKHNYNSGDYEGWDGLQAAIMKDNNVAVILPLYLYDHSGITINTTGFSCQWDSGQIGFIFISKEKVKEEYSAKIVSKKLKERVAEYLKNEVEGYDKYLRGECYGYVIDSEHEENIDSCWGYDDKDYMLGEAKSVVDSLTKGV